MYSIEFLAIMEQALGYAMAALVGFSLSAACGMRIFAPLALLSVAVHFGWVNAGESFSWVGSTPAVCCFAVACVVEMLGMMIPWLDHILDIAGAPVAAVAGTVVMATQLAAGAGVDTSVVPPWVTWSLAAVVGGGVATGVHIAAGTIRAGSTGVSGGLLNPIFALVETVSSVVLSALALLLPVVAAILGLLLVIAIIVFSLAILKWIARRGAARAKTVQATS